MQLTIKWLNQKHSVWNCEEHCHRLPVYYFILCILAALIGYYFILCFPILFAISLYEASVVLPIYPMTYSFTTTLLWISLSLLFAHISLNTVTIDFASLPGLQLKRTGPGRLNQLLDALGVHYRRPRICHIVITDHFELKILKAPRYGIPILCDNILVIGLPLILTLSPGQFKCLLTREIIQHSKNRRKIASWLNQLREIWERYRSVLKSKTGIGHQLLYGFFTLYSPLYKAVSLPARINDELHADRNTLDLINSDELLSAFYAKQIAEHYFTNRFWPEVQRAGGGIRPFSRLQLAAKNALSRSNSEAWLQSQHFETAANDGLYPTLQQRMDNLGLTTVKLPPDLQQSAAEYYFQHQLGKIIYLSDNNWQQKQQPAAAAKPVNHMAGRLFNAAVKTSRNAQKGSTV